MNPRLIGVVEQGVFKPLGHIHFSGLRGRDAADGSGTTPLSPRVPLPTSSKLGVSALADGKDANGAGVGSPAPAILPGPDELHERFSDEGVHPHDFEDAAA